MSVGLSEQQVGVGTCLLDPIVNLITQDVLYGLVLGLGLRFLEFLYSYVLSVWSRCSGGVVSSNEWSVFCGSVFSMCFK